MTIFTFEETNLICYYREMGKDGTVAAIAAALPYMTAGLQELAKRTVKKLNRITEEEFSMLAITPTEAFD